MKPKSILETQLTELQQAQLAEWLLSGMPYYKAQEKVAVEFGVTVKSLKSFSQYWSSVCASQLLERRQRLGSMANVQAEAAQKHPAQFEAATLDALQQKALELANSPQSDAKDVKSILMLLLKAKDQGLTERQLDLDREKFEFNAAELCLKHLPTIKVIAKDPKLGQRERVQQIRLKLFGSLPE